MIPHIKIMHDIIHQVIVVTGFLETVEPMLKKIKFIHLINIIIIIELNYWEWY